MRAFQNKFPVGLLGLLASISFAIALVAGCSHSKSSIATTRPGAPLHRTGDEIVVCGQLFHIGTPVVLWMDPGGYDAYRVEKRFGPIEKASWQATTQQSWHVADAATRPWSPNRYDLRAHDLTPAQIEEVRGGGWPLALLQQKVDQFVIHYDVAGVSMNCFKTLQDSRDLSVQFMLDIDGTIYQTLDLKERAWQAAGEKFYTKNANARSIGIEIANMGSYSSRESKIPLTSWYTKDPDGMTRITIPAHLGTAGVRTPNFVGRPMRNEMVVGEVQHQVQRQYDFTPQQYASLIKLTAALCRIFPKIRCDYPRDENGNLIPYRLTPDQWNFYTGVLGHYHVQSNKSDPGPAFQWDLVINGARALLNQKPVQTLTVTEQ
jgi:N-acetylmuramoyl-L-alanine amidase